LKYVIIGVVVVVVVVAAVLVLVLPTLHRVPVQYVGSPSGYEAFVPSSQTVNYHGHTDPVGILILSNGTTIQNVVWNGKYAGRIIHDHNAIEQLNNQFLVQTDPVNYQPYVPLQDFYVIKGQVPIEQATINGQTYYVIIEVNSISVANMSGFFTYEGWINNFVAAINTPGTYAAVLPGNSPVFTWENLTGTVAYQTMTYGSLLYYSGGGVVLVLPNGTLIPYGLISPFGVDVPFNSPSQVYNPSS